MTTVRGVLRSTITRTGQGHADDQQTARAEAIANTGDLTGFEVTQVSTVSSKASGDITIEATARSTETRPHEASGADYRTAKQQYDATIPDGWQSQHIIIAE
ncbi:hypothetical protein [Curtobacterium sp. MCBD17_040]|uniref:hypothetical protein n=1 Tax=Curtobacterium sp. MCBD17_040 TaxID=2175674 RepID=UPI000DA89095|nr:hypothetical protein [Curtobacterium sp. MCBD17_040]WIB65491.1 hypothetical protein DEI94_19145 [Curtobacterium sp. MCBD17_040]